MTNRTGSSFTERQILAQLDAMHATEFELLLLDLSGSRQATLLTSDTAGILRRLGWLRAQNRRGLNINIRPTGNHLSLLDDLSLEQVETMIVQGFEPCVVVETSPANYQAWLDHGRNLGPQEPTIAARLLAQRFGSDLGAAGRRHAGRLAGFTNRKPSRQLPNGLFPFVRLHAAKRTSYLQAEAFFARVEGLAAESTRPHMPPPFDHAAGRPLLPIARFHADPRYGGDLSRADFAYAIYAVAHGVSSVDIEEAILSREMSKKGNQLAQGRYARYTVHRASKRARP